MPENVSSGMVVRHHIRAVKLNGIVAHALVIPALPFPDVRPFPIRIAPASGAICRCWARACSSPASADFPIMRMPRHVAFEDIVRIVSAHSLNDQYLLYKQSLAIHCADATRAGGRPAAGCGAGAMCGAAAACRGQRPPRSPCWRRPGQATAATRVTATGMRERRRSRRDQVEGSGSRLLRRARVGRG